VKQQHFSTANEEIQIMPLEANPVDGSEIPNSQTAFVWM